MIIALHLTSDCNLRCDYCYGGPKAPDHLPVPIALSAIDRLAADGEADIIFFGGEPLLRFEAMRQIVKACEERPLRLHFQVVTNGTLCSPDFVQWSAEHRVSVSLSVDGCQKAHDLHRKTRSGAPTFDRVASIIPTLLQTNPYLHVQMVISPDTAALVAHSVEVLMGLGVRHVSTALDYRAAWDRAAMQRLGESYQRLAGLYERWTLQDTRFFLSCFDTRIQTHVRGPCRPEERCVAGLHQVSVSPRGELYPCVQFVGDGAHCIGTVESGFDEPARARFVAECESEKEPCVGCALQGRCANWCACVNWASSASLRQVSPVLCEHERMLMPIVDAVASRLFQRRQGLFLHKHYNAAYPILSVTADLFEKVGR